MSSGTNRAIRLSALLTIAFLGLAAKPAVAQAKTVTYAWSCEQEQCHFDATGTTTTGLSSITWSFGDGSYAYGAPPSILTVDHAYDVGYGLFYFDVTLTPIYFSNTPPPITCTIFFSKSQLGGVPSSRGTCSN